MPAYVAGASGAGVTAAVIDSGVAATTPEFAGRISAASQDISGSRGVGDDGGHGTAVSAVLLAARNNSRIQGMAFGATLLSLRTDTPGSCNAQGDCSHTDNNLARALDVAVSQGARVANLSLGGSSANATLRAAIGRATAAGMVIVMSAGNDQGAANPSALAQIAIDPIARNQIIVAGSHGDDRVISSFSNRAGNAANVYVTALGEDVLSFDENGTNFLYSGTSFSAPLVSGAVALLAQAFPNLSGAEIVRLLLESADDLGAAGTDSIYGRGGLNIGRAFEPRGGASLAGSAVAVDLNAPNATLSPAMGDAAQQQMGAIILDGFDRAYAIDLAQSISRARPRSNLAGTLGQPLRSATLAAGGMTAAVSIAEAPDGVTLQRLALGTADAVRARATAGMIASRIDRKTSVALGFGQSGGALAGQLTGRAEPAFLVARGPADSLGFDRSGQEAASIRHELGRLGVTAAAENGTGLLFQGRMGLRDPYARSPYSLLSLGADRHFGALLLGAGVTRLSEERTLLGARLGPAFGGGGATSWFTDVRADWRFAPGWSLGGAMRHGWTGAIRTNAFSFDMAGTGLLQPDDRIAIRIAQPLRVEKGALRLSLPSAYDYATGAIAYEEQRLNLAPNGREIDLELAYSRLMLGGRIDANLFWRRDPGNFAVAPDDLGAALRWRVGF